VCVEAGSDAGVVISAVAAGYRRKRRSEFRGVLEEFKEESILSM
jgi:hypothetical protein